MGIPLRPIVSAIGSPTNRLAKKLAKILSPLAGKTSSFVKNSTDFANQIKQKTIQSSDTMVGFDVVSLFTKVPIADALATISNLLSQDESLRDRTAIPAEEICTLVELCLRSTYFEFQGRRSSDGLPSIPSSSQAVHGKVAVTFETSATSASSATSTAISASWAATYRFCSRLSDNISICIATQYMVCKSLLCISGRTKKSAPSRSASSATASATSSTAYNFRLSVDISICTPTQYMGCTCFLFIC